MRFSINTKIYPLEAVLSTTYLFLDNTYIYLRTKGRDMIEASLKNKKGKNLKQLLTLKDEFFNELLNSALRMKVTKRNENIRQYIIQRALFSAASDSLGGLSDEGSNEYKEDPLGIAIPWEEKK